MSPVLRVATTHRTQAILSLSWSVKTRKGSGSRANSHVEEFRRLLDRPDPQNGYNFEGWLRSVLEEVYVTDALTIYPVRNRVGRVVAFMQVDGQTIKPLIDYARGGIPAPPAAAYVQYIKGTSYTAFTSEQLLYRPFRPRVWCVYGQSRVENVLSNVLLYQLHENWVGDYFQQGNIPEAALILDPAQTDLNNADKFDKWQKLLDLQSGQNVGRRRLHMMPGFVKAVQQLKAFTFDENLPSWLVRILCVEYGMPSYVFVSETNRATAKEVNKTLSETPHRAELMSIKRLFDELASFSGYPELEFNWSKDMDYSEESVKGIIALSTPFPDGTPGIMNRDEARAYLGLEPDDEGAGDLSDTDDDTVQASEGNPAVESDTGDEADTDQKPDDESDQKILRFDAKSAAPAPRAAGKTGRKFQKPGAGEKARIASGMAGTIFKRLRRNQSEIMKAAVERAKHRQKKVKGA
jgi:hypothetical protein